MKVQWRRSWFVALVVLMTALHARADGDLPPARVSRHVTPNGVSFHIARDPGSTTPASLATQAAEDAGEPAFYLFRAQHRATIPVSQFIDEQGRLQLVTAAAEVDAMRSKDAEELEQSLFIYAQPVEGSSELFRLRKAATGEVLYTVDPIERSRLLAIGWTSMPSLGWTQAIDSSGVGILKPDTIKLAQPEVDDLAAVHGFGRQLIFRNANEVVSAIRVGTVLYSERSEPLPFGLVHRVDAVLPTGDGGVIVKTSPAELLDAFEEVHLYLQGARFGFLRADQTGDWSAPSQDRRHVRSQASSSSVFDGKVTKEISAEWKSKSKGVESRLSLAGKASFGVIVDGQYSDDRSCPVNPVATFVITPYQEYKVSIEASGSISKDNEKRLVPPIDGTVFLSGIPFSATFSVYGGYEVSGSLSASATFTETGQTSAVVRWNKSNNNIDTELCPKTCPSGFRCGPGSKPPSGGTCSLTTTFEGEAGSSATASVYVRPEMFVYIGARGSGFGPFADVKLQLQARKEAHATALYGQLIPTVGAKLKIGCFEKKPVVATYNPPNGFEKSLGKIPVAPTGVSATDGKTKGKVTVSWKEIPNVAGYEVYRSTSLNGSKSKLTSKLVTSSKFDDSTVKGTTKYYYWVRAVIGKLPGPFGASDTGFAK